MHVCLYSCVHTHEHSYDSDDSQLLRVVEHTKLQSVRVLYFKSLREIAYANYRNIMLFMVTCVDSHMGSETSLPCAIDPGWSWFRHD